MSLLANGVPSECRGPGRNLRSLWALSRSEGLEASVAVLGNFQSHPSFKDFQALRTLALTPGVVFSGSVHQGPLGSFGA